MKRSELLFSFLLLPVDFLMVLAAGIAVYFLRYETFLTEVRPVIFSISLPHYLRIVAVVALLWLPFFALAGMYSLRASRRAIDEFAKVFVGCSVGLVLIVFIIFFRHELFGSRFLVLAGWLFAVFFVFAGRLLVRAVQRSLFQRGVGVLRLVLIGDDKVSYDLEKILRHRTDSPYRLVRRFRKLDESSWKMLSNLAGEQAADLVIQSDVNAGRRETLALWQFCQEHHLDFAYAADVFETAARNVAVSSLAEVPLIQLKRTPLDGWGKIVKRALDVVLSLAALVFIIPLAIVLGLTIKADSPGPVFVKLQRVGEGGRKFWLYKFRSMIAGAHELKEQLQLFNERAGGPLFKMRADPRITSAGHFLRKWSLDELPNFINVLKGEMSLVGPRPHEPAEVEQYRPEQRKLLNIKPGVTGPSQISGRSDLDFAEEAKLDMFYVENWSFWLDMQVILRTPVVVLSRKSAV